MIDKSLEIKERAPENLLTIDNAFADGSSTMTYLGRNDGIIRVSLELIRQKPDRILMLGCGPYELWTTAGQAKLWEDTLEIVGVDINPKIVNLNQRIKEKGAIAIAEIAPLVGNPIFGMDRHRNSEDLLRESDIHGIGINEDAIEIDLKNRNPVRIEPPADALTYVENATPNSFSFIFAGNLENNLVFQQGYTLEKAIGFRRLIARLLKPQGIYAFTTNDLFFNEQTPNSTRNVLQVLDSSGLEILYKATQLTHVLEKDGKRYLSDNCGLITARKGEFETFPNGDRSIELIRKRLVEYRPDFEFVENSGSFEDFKHSLENQTNIAIIKIGKDQFHWFNVEGSYKDVFGRLAQSNTGFYPELFTALVTPN